MTQENNIPPVNPGLRRPPIPTANARPISNAAIPADIPSQHIQNNNNGIKSDLSFEIKGGSSQFIEITLRPGQSITGEVTALMYYEAGINMKMRSGSSMDAVEGGFGFFGKLLGMGKSVLKGEKLFMMVFTNSTQKELKIAFAMPYLGTIVPINLGASGGELFCQNDSFLCATNDLRISTASSRELGANFLNAVTSIQKIQGNGTLFLFAGGSLETRKLIPGETLNVTAGAALAMQPSIVFKNKTIRNVGIAGQGHMLTEISGAGLVWVQSLPYKRMKDNLIAQVGIFFGIKPKKKGLAVQVTK